MSHAFEIVNTPASAAEAFAIPHWSHYNQQSGTAWNYARGGLLVRECGHVRGALVYSLCGGVGHLGQVIVDPAHQRRGLGRALVCAFEELVRQAHGHKITLEAAAWQSLGFFERLGYRERAVFPRDKFELTWYRYDKDLR